MAGRASLEGGDACPGGRDSASARNPTRGGEPLMDNVNKAHVSDGSTLADASQQHAAHAHAAPTGFIRKYIFSLDHKVIGIQYFFLALASVFVGLALSVFMRLHLAYPDLHLLKDETYLGLLTLHGTFMVFFVLTTA